MTSQNKLPEIGENVYSRITLDDIAEVKNIITENLTPKHFDSSGPQHIVEFFNGKTAIVSRAGMGHLIFWGYVANPKVSTDWNPTTTEKNPLQVRDDNWSFPK
jgi:hypothetical protein